MLICDLSHYRPIVDIDAAIAAGLGAVIYKATESIGIADATYANAKEICEGAGVLFGAYHFGRDGSGVDQANYFLSVAQPDEHTLVALDWEASMGLAGAEQFVSRIYDVLGRWPVVYTRKTYAEPLIGNKATLLTNCPLWVASYQSSPNWPKQWPSWALQQYSNGTDGPTPHGIAGIRPDIDMNILNPRFGDLRAWWGTDLAEPPNPPVADKFVAPIGPAGLQPNGLWLKAPVQTPGLWYDANNYGNYYQNGSQFAYHTGADLNQANDGDKYQPIRAVCNGVILFADRITGSSWGNLIIQESVLADGSKVWFRYAHSDNLLVKAGDLVTCGQHLSDVSNAFGLEPFHCHFDVSLSGVLSQGYDGAHDWPGLNLTLLHVNYVDPYSWLESHMESVPVTNIVNASLGAVIPLFDAPSLAARMIDLVPAGVTLPVDKDTLVVAEGHNWYRLDAGYVDASCLTFAADAPVTRYVNTPGQSLNIRDSGSLSGKLIGSLLHQTMVTVILPANASNYVQLVTASGTARTGWVSATYLSTTRP